MNREILNLAIPNIISNITVPLLSSVDTAITGHMDGVHYVGAISIGGMIFSFLYWGFGFLRMGTTGLTAQSFGQKDEEGSYNHLFRAAFLAIGISALLLLLQSPIKTLAFSLIDSSDEVIQYGSSYYDIRIWGAPAVLLTFALNGWFFGMQNARVPMVTTVLINLSNIGFSLFFVYQMGMDSDGVALGTLVANYIGLTLIGGMALRQLWKKKPEFRMAVILKTEELWRLFNVNRDIFIRTMCLIITYSFFTLQSAAMGEDILALNTILMQLWYIMAYGVDGFAYAAESITGKYVGEGNKQKLSQSMLLTTAWGMGLGVLFTIIYAIFNVDMVSLFTDQQNLIELAEVFILWTIFAPLVNAFSFMLDGIFIGATETKAMRNSMIIATFFIFFPIYYLTVSHIGNHAIWLAMTLYMLARGVALLFFLPGITKRAATN
jgi:MATE family multidrug resistance protein